jgi:hypothetical protein
VKTGECHHNPGRDRIPLVAGNFDLRPVQGPGLRKNFLQGRRAVSLLAGMVGFESPQRSGTSKPGSAEFLGTGAKIMKTRIARLPMGIGASRPWPIVVLIRTWRRQYLKLRRLRSGLDSESTFCVITTWDLGPIARTAALR